jgi:hypothetical protein
VRRAYLWLEVLGTHPKAGWATIRVRGSPFIHDTRPFIQDHDLEGGYLLQQIITQPEGLREKALSLLSMTKAILEADGVETLTDENSCRTLKNL